MSQDIINEIMFLLHALLLGIVITFIYDWFVVSRRVIKHTMLLISLEDILFWIACAISVFYMLYEENNGALRWFAVAGAALGMVIYKKTLSTYFIKIAVKVFSGIIAVLAKIFGFLGKPVKLAVTKLSQGQKTVSGKGITLGRYIKKKLTEYLKLLKMILCKQ